MLNPELKRTSFLLPNVTLIHTYRRLDGAKTGASLVLAAKEVTQYELLLLANYTEREGLPAEKNVRSKTSPAQHLNMFTLQLSLNNNCYPNFSHSGCRCLS